MNAPAHWIQEQNNRERDSRRQAWLEKEIGLTRLEADFVNKNLQNEIVRSFCAMLQMAIRFYDEPSLGILKGSASDLRAEIKRLKLDAPLLLTTFGALEIGDVFSLNGFDGFYEKTSAHKFRRYLDPKAKENKALFATQVYYRKVK